jgi:hypothetical protein
MDIKLKEKSFIARLAALILKEKNMAIVFGKTIYLWNASSEELIKNKKWLRHELAHVQQYKQYGFLQFLFLYIRESVKNGYYKNRFEVAARAKEITADLEVNFEIRK